MVKTKEFEYLLADGSIDLEAWLAHIGQFEAYKDSKLIRNAALLSQVAGEDQATISGESCLQQGLAIADILADLNADKETLAAAIIYDSVAYAELSLDDVRDQLGDTIVN